jgi:hypothetical protein
MVCDFAEPIPLNTLLDLLVLVLPPKFLLPRQPGIIEITIGAANLLGDGSGQSRYVGS